MAVLHPTSVLILSVGLLVSLTTSLRHEEGRNTIDDDVLSTKKVKTGKGGVDVLGQEPQDAVANDTKKPASLSQHAIATKESRGVSKTGKGGADVLGQEPQDGSSDPGDVGEIEYTNRKEEASNASFDNSVANDTKEPSSLSQHAIADRKSVV